jgi:ribose transport system substrate-binding protein
MIRKRGPLSSALSAVRSGPTYRPAVALGLALAVGVAGYGSASAGAKASAASGKQLNVAYFSFAVQNSFDAAMLAAVRKEAAADNVKLTVFDGNNSSQTQYNDIQDAISTGTYSGFLIQPVDGTGLLPLVKTAIAKHIQVVALNQVLGPNLNTAAPQVSGLAGSVVFPAFRQGTLDGKLTEQACASLKVKTCEVGYVYQVKASGFDQAVHSGFASVIAHDSKIKVVAEGQDLFTPSGGLTAAQTMLQAQPGINVFVGSDQGMEGATKYIQSTRKKILIIGQGGSTQGIANVKKGIWFADVMQEPDTQGDVALQDLVKALRTGKQSGGLVVESRLPNSGDVTKQNSSKFTGQWTA